MPDRFDYFVVFAEMRTGSNFLETNLNAVPGITCHGEAFNPHFLGYPNRTELLGLSQEARDADPMRLLAAIRSEPGGISGFRYFHDHDPRVLEPCLADPRCAKIVLTRNPLDSYVSWKIARETGQWKLTNVTRRREATARFDAAEFEGFVTELQDFQVRLLRALQTTGQTAFYIAYEDLQSVEVMNGLALWLGADAPLQELDRTLKRQNPEPVTEKVENPEEIGRGLARLDRFNLSRTPNFEPRRGPAVPGYVAAPHAPLLYMPLRGGPEPEIRRWLAGLDGADEEALRIDFTQKSLRDWMRAHSGHRRFTVLRHPVARAHAVFCERILSTGKGRFGQIRKVLRRAHGLALPDSLDAAGHDLATHRALFHGFLRFLKANLAGLTNVRVDAHWCSQAQAIQGMGEFALPDMVLREDEAALWLPALAAQVGRPEAPALAPSAPDSPFALADVYNEETEALTREAYARDYLVFGFDDWR